MPRARITILRSSFRGCRRVANRFVPNKAGYDYVQEAIGAGLLNFGYALENRAKAHAPVRGGNRSFAPDGPVGGTLRRSIHTIGWAMGRLLGHTQDENGTAVPQDYPQGGTVVYVGTNVFYARFVHDGTSKMAARPFLAEALAEVRGSLLQLVKQGMGKYLNHLR